MVYHTEEDREETRGSLRTVGILTGALMAAPSHRVASGLEPPTSLMGGPNNTNNTNITASTTTQDHPAQLLLALTYDRAKNTVRVEATGVPDANHRQSNNREREATQQPQTTPYIISVEESSSDDDQAVTLRKLATIPATRPWTEREDQFLFDATLMGESIHIIAATLERDYEETKQRICAHTNPEFIDSKLPEEWMRPYFTVLGELARNGYAETPWSAAETEELMLFKINGHKLVDPLVFAEDRTADAVRIRMRYVTAPAGPFKTTFESLKNREAKELKRFQNNMTDEEWTELGLTPPVRKKAKEQMGRREGKQKEGGAAEAVQEEPRTAKTDWHEEAGKDGVVVVIDD